MFLTRAHDAGIFPVLAVVGSPGLCPALGKGGLRPGAAYVVQPDGVYSLPIASPANGRQCHPAAQLPADHAGSVEVPVVITHCPPGAVVQHLQLARAGVRAIHQPYVSRT